MKKIKLLTSLSALSIIGASFISLSSCSHKPEPSQIKYKITFSCSDGVVLSSTDPIEVNEKTKWKDVNVPIATVSAEYIGIGWYDTKEMKALEPETEITKDISVKYIAYKKTEIFVNVTVEVDDETYGPATFIQGRTFAEFKEAYPDMKIDPIKEHFTFDGWFVDSQKIDNNYVFPVGKTDIKIKAHFTQITYDVSKAGSSLDVSFENLPSKINDGDGINATYTFDTGTKKLDETNSDILVGGQSIKTKEGVKFTQGQVLIPANLINGNVQINIIIVDRQHYQLSTAGTSEGVTFENIFGYAIEGITISGRYYYDKTLATGIIEDECDILVSGVSIKNKQYVKYKDGEIFIPGNLVTGNVQIKIVTKSILIADSWTNIISYCNQYESGQLTKQQFITSFKTNDGKTIQNEDELIGTVVKTTINSQTHIIRIIGVDHDTITNTGGKKAALTFETLTLLSDQNGQPMFTKWDTTNNFKYTNSILRANLNGTGTGTKTFDSTVLSMLPSEIQDGIKTVTKEVGIRDYIEEQFVVTEYNDKLFPLTKTEINSDGIRVEGKQYKYWQTHKLDKDRVKWSADKNNHSYWLASPSSPSSGQYVSTVTSTGNFSTETVTLTASISFGFCI